MFDQLHVYICIMIFQKLLNNSCKNSKSEQINSTMAATVAKIIIANSEDPDQTAALGAV